MVNLIILQFAIILVVIYQVHSVSVYSWTLTGRKLCWNNATKEKTEELLNCDKLMRSEVCFWKISDRNGIIALF